MIKDNILTRAWIIQKVWTKESNEVVSILKRQKSFNQIGSYLKQIYIDNELNIIDKFLITKNYKDYFEWKSNPLNLKWNLKAKTITIWHNPFYIAKKVKNIKINNMECWNEILTWEEIK